MIIYVDSKAHDDELEFVAHRVSESYGTEFRVFRRYYSKGVEQIGAVDVDRRAEYEQSAKDAAATYRQCAAMGPMPYGC